MKNPTPVSLFKFFLEISNKNIYCSFSHGFRRYLSPSSPKQSIHIHIKPGNHALHNPIIQRIWRFSYTSNVSYKLHFLKWKTPFKPMFTFYHFKSRYLQCTEYIYTADELLNLEKEKYIYYCATLRWHSNQLPILIVGAG